MTADRGNIASDTHIHHRNGMTAGIARDGVKGVELLSVDQVFVKDNASFTVERRCQRFGGGLASGIVTSGKRPLSFKRLMSTTNKQNV